jgi:hypothetical protein
MIKHHDQEDNQSNGDNNDINNNTDGDELVIDGRIGEQRQAERQRLLTEIAQSTQDASDELRLMNDNVENLTREVRGTKEAIKSLTDVLRKYLENRNQDKNHNNKA